MMRLPRMAADTAHNRRCVGQRRILIVRHAGKPAHVFNHFLSWMDAEAAEVAQLFEFHALPCSVRNWSRYALHAPWIADTVRQWSPGAFRRAGRIAAGCDRRGIPVINRLDRTTACTKLEVARRLAACGIRTPQTVAIDDFDAFRHDGCGLKLPLLVRDDEGHGQPAYLVTKHSQLMNVPLRRFHSPIAVEYVDVRDPHDGLYRKYRYFAFGEAGVPRHLIVNDHWEVRPKRRVMNQAARVEELDFVNRPDANHEALQRARRALGLDVVGFDYSYDQAGRMVVWEANAFADLNYPKNPWCEHIAPAVRLSFAALCWLYLTRAGLEVPGVVGRYLSSEAFSREPAVRRLVAA